MGGVRGATMALVTINVIKFVRDSVQHLPCLLALELIGSVYSQKDRNAPMLNAMVSKGLCDISDQCFVVYCFHNRFFFHVFTKFAPPFMNDIVFLWSG